MPNPAPQETDSANQIRSIALLPIKGDEPIFELFKRATALTSALNQWRSDADLLIKSMIGNRWNKLTGVHAFIRRHEHDACDFRYLRFNEAGGVELDEVHNLRYPVKSMKIPEILSLLMHVFRESFPDCYKHDPLPPQRKTNEYGDPIIPEDEQPAPEPEPAPKKRGGWHRKPKAAPHPDDLPDPDQTLTTSLHSDESYETPSPLPTDQNSPSLPADEAFAPTEAELQPHP